MPPKSIYTSIVATLFLLSIYFTVTSLISGANFAFEQFAKFWYFIIALALGFGIQVGLYTYLKTLTHGARADKVTIAASGTTSTIAMISCCTHYLANLIPIIGISAIASFIGQYQIELFWVGIVSNVVGMAAIGRRIYKIRKSV